MTEVDTAVLAVAVPADETEAPSLLALTVPLLAAVVPAVGTPAGRGAPAGRQQTGSDGSQATRAQEFQHPSDVSSPALVASSLTCVPCPSAARSSR